MLTLYDDYSREEAHALFEQVKPFVPQAGTWGLQGIVPISDRPGDYVFFVTLGKQEGAHVFDESITIDGVLSWQSQPSQRLQDKQVKAFINHDETKNTIYIFLRTATRTKKYTYLGTLKYLTHDAQREAPVHFLWQILEGEPPKETCERIGLELLELNAPKPVNENDVLIETAPPPVGSGKIGVATTQFVGRKSPDYAERDRKNRELGLQGELLVVKQEIAALRAAGREDLAAKVKHVSVEEGDGAGYDILSYDAAGGRKFIEVKTTKGVADTDFYISSHELAFATLHPDNYHLYRLYEFDMAAKSARFFKIEGSIEKRVLLTPREYRARLL